MNPYDILANSPFALSNTAPPPELLNLPQENSNLPQYQPPPQNLNINPQPPNFSPYSTNQNYNPLINPTATGILNLKLEYAAADDAINFYNNYLQNGNDTQKKEAQARINLARNYQNALTNEADMWRATAHGLGIDTSGFNKDNTLAESQQLMQLNDARAVQHLLNLQSVGQRQRDYYQQMRNAGLSPREAREAAAQMHDEFQDDMSGQLLNGLQNYGFNPDGSMNPFGAGLLSRLATVNPYLAEPLFKALPTPNNAYSEANANYRQEVAADRQAQLQDQNFRNDLLKLQKVQDFTREENERATKLEMLKAALKGTGVAQDKMQQELEFLTRAFGGDEQKAMEVYTVQNYPNYFKINRDANGNIQLTDKEKVANLTSSRFAAIEYFLGKNDFETAQSFIQQYRDALTSDEFKYAEQLDGASVTYALTVLDLYQKVSEGKLTLEEMQNLLKGGRGNSVADLSRANNDNAANAKAKKIGEQKAAELKRRRAEEENYAYQPPQWYDNSDIPYSRLVDAGY